MSNPYPAPGSLIVKRCGIHTMTAKRDEVDISHLGLNRTPQILVQAFNDDVDEPMVFAAVVEVTPEAFTVEVSAEVAGTIVHWLAIA